MPKVTDLITETTVAPTAVIPMVDVATNKTKQTTVSTLAASLAFANRFGPLDSPTFTGTVTVPTGVAGTSAVNKAQMDTALALKANSATPTFTGPVTVPYPIAFDSAANKLYVENAINPGEVWVGIDAPTDPSVELWFDSDATLGIDIDGGTPASSGTDSVDGGNP